MYPSPEPGPADEPKVIPEEDLIEHLGPYDLLRRLGSGGMAEVHLARASGLEGFAKLIVVKRILPHLSADPHFVRMFLAEARLAALLNHPNVVQVYDLGRDGDYYFTMEFVYGENLQRIVRAARRRPEMLPIEIGVGIGIGVASGLHYAHERVGFDGKPLGLVHRDVSPTNVMVTYDGCVKVADFGIAKVITRTDLTTAGTRKGKVPYMSPEQCRAERIDRRSDVFALGIVLYECTTMTRLFDGDNEFGVMNRIVNGDIPPPSTRRSGYPRELERIVMRALSIDPNERYASAELLQMDLEQLAQDKRWSCSPHAIGRWMEAMFKPRPFPWCAHVAEGAPPGPPPSSMSTLADAAHSSISAPGFPPSRPDLTPHSAEASFQAVSGSRVSRVVPPPPSGLRRVAIGLGVLAGVSTMAVLGLVVHHELTRDPATAPPAEASDADPSPAPAAVLPAALPGAPPTDAPEGDEPVADDQAPDEAAPDEAAPDEAAPDEAAEAPDEAVEPADEPVLVVEDPVARPTTRRRGSRNGDADGGRTRRSSRSGGGKKDSTSSDATPKTKKPNLDAFMPQ